MAPRVAESRGLFTTFCIMMDLWVANTQFRKRDGHLATIRNAGTNKIEPPVNTTRYGQVDYVLTAQRWKNSIQDCYIDKYPTAVSDHFPLISKIKVKLVRTKPRNSRPQKIKRAIYGEELDAFNDQIIADYDKATECCNMTHYEELVSSMSDAQAKYWTEPHPEKKRNYISEKTWALIQTRDKHRQKWSEEQLKAANKHIRKCAKRDRKQHIMDTVKEELDIRDKWMGLRQMKTGYKPKTFAKCDKDGHPVRLSEQAEATAEYLASVHWADKPGEPQDEEVAKSVFDDDYFLFKHVHHYRTGDFSMEELEARLAALKPHKAPGPDGLTTNAFKDLHPDVKVLILSLMNQWLYNQYIPDDQLMAKVIAIYKKGNPKLQENYRPISLLNTLNKLFAAMLKIRIEAGIERELPKTFYGFRKGKSTTEAISIIRRIQEGAEAGKTPCHFILLDWEKAFDRVRIPKMLEALERFGVPIELIMAIKALYRNSQFVVEENGYTSAPKQQKRGIRQGCPLSPYLFVITMAALLRDAEATLTKRRDKIADKLKFDSVLYADDTILFGQSHKAVTEKLRAIEQASEKYGLSLNKTKCLHIAMNSPHYIRFSRWECGPERKQGGLFRGHSIRKNGGSCGNRRKNQEVQIHLEKNGYLLEKFGLHKQIQAAGLRRGCQGKTGLRTRSSSIEPSPHQ